VHGQVRAALSGAQGRLRGRQGCHPCDGGTSGCCL
jgi:hypothetical protein